MAERGYQMVRYADDFVILGESKEQAEGALREICSSGLAGGKAEVIGLPYPDRAAAAFAGGEGLVVGGGFWYDFGMSGRTIWPWHFAVSPRWAAVWRGATMAWQTPLPVMN